MITLPPVKAELRESLLQRYADISTEELEDAARCLPGGQRINFQEDRAVIIAFLQGTR